VLSLKKIVSAIIAPLLYLNLAGLAAGAVWLGVLAQWQVIWLGFLMIFFSPYIIPILMVPAGVCSHFMTLYGVAQRRQHERLMFVLTIGYILSFVTFWYVGVFEYVMQSVVLPQARFAALLWANTAALTPLLMWASRDRNNIFVMTMTEMAQVAALALTLLCLTGVVPAFWTAAAIFGGILALAATLQAVYEEKFMRKSADPPR
jgi:hypothetical protein